jgi:hypothetical protein
MRIATFNLTALLAVMVCVDVAQAQAQAQPTPLPENTIPCEAFKRSPDGVWRVDEPVTFDVGSTKAMTLQPTSIPRGAIAVADGQDLAEILDRKCGGRA